MDQFFTEFSDWKHAEKTSNTQQKFPFLGQPIIGNLSLVHCVHYVDLLGDLMYSSVVLDYIFAPGPGQANPAPPAWNVFREHIRHRPNI